MRVVNRHHTKKLCNSMRSNIDGCPCCGRPDFCYNDSFEKHNEIGSYPVKLTTYNTSPMNGAAKSLAQDSVPTVNVTATSQISTETSTPANTQNANSDTQDKNSDGVTA